MSASFRERINQGSSQSHARNSFAALTAVSCTATDVLRQSYSDVSQWGSISVKSIVIFQGRRALELSVKWM